MSARDRLAHWRPVGSVAAFFGYMRLTVMERGPDGRPQFVNPHWVRFGRRRLRAMKRELGKSPW